MANEAKPCPCDIGDRMEYGGLGEEVQIEHIKAYVTKPSVDSDKAVIVIHDIFGWQLPNTRYMADLLASNGYVAVCPDLFVGKEPWSQSNDWSTFQKWLEDKKATNINKEVDAVLKYLSQKCGAKRIVAVGFCWGGVATHHLGLHYPQIKACVSVYVNLAISMVASAVGGNCVNLVDLRPIAGIIRDIEDRYNLQSPTLFIFGEKDHIIPLDQVNVLEKKLQEKCTADFQVKIFPGQTHGFVHRKREDINPNDKPFIQEARMDLLNWFNKYV